MLPHGGWGAGSLNEVLELGVYVDVSLKVTVLPGRFVIWDGVGRVANRIEQVPHSELPRVVLKSSGSKS